MKRQPKACGFLLFQMQPPEAFAPEPEGISFLLMKHAGRWDLPKGHMDRGETELGTALRELYEETAIPEESLRIDPSFRFETRYPVRIQKDEGRLAEKTVVIFLAELVRPVEIRVTEHESWQWFPWNPPHSIQKWTIDPLLAALEAHWKNGRK